MPSQVTLALTMPDPPFSIPRRNPVLYARRPMKGRGERGSRKEQHMSSKAVHRDPDAIEEEVVKVHGQHRARYQVLFSADRTETDSLTCGVASVRPASR